MSRDITEVIDAMLAEIPSSEVDLIQALEHVKKSAGYTAPEVMYIRWHKLTEIMQGQVGKPTNDWQCKACDILRGLAGPGSEALEGLDSMKVWLRPVEP